MRRFVNGRLGGVVLPVLGLALLVAVWWLAVLAFHVQPFILPTPWQVARVFVDSPRDLLGHLRASTVETLEGYALAVVVGLAIALAVAGSRVVLVFLVCFFPIVVSAVAGLTTTPAELAELARSLSASRRQMFLKVRVPAALPHIFVGLKVGLTLAVIGATVAELNGATEGLMYAVQSYSGQGATAPAVAALVLLGAVSVVLYYLLVAVERRLLPWARETSG